MFFNDNGIIVAYLALRIPEVEEIGGPGVISFRESCLCSKQTCPTKLVHWRPDE